MDIFQNAFPYKDTRLNEGVRGMKRESKNVSCIISSSTMEIGIKIVWRVTMMLKELRIKPLTALCLADPCITSVEYI